MSAESRTRLFRRHDDDGGDVVTNIELFFDLVFVFAITQLSHRLLSHLTVHGTIETFALFCAVWWLWIYTSWATNWLDPERIAVRAMVVVMMLGGLVMSVALPDAFGNSGAVFAGAYVAMQVGRTLAIAIASRGIDEKRVRNFLRITFYFILAAPFWAAGAVNEADTRLLLWAIALTIEYAGPVLYFRTPGLGHSSAADWDISGAHMAERCSLFVIIALGESILVAGATYAGLKVDAATSVALVASFAGSVAMWWIYFDTGEKRATKLMEETEDTGRLARNAYTYLHMLIIAGVIVTAVADELMLSHPSGHAGREYILAAYGGPALVLLGNGGFKWITAGRRLPPLSHITGIAVLGLLGVGTWHGDASPLLIGIATSVALVLTAVWEWLSLNGGWQRWTPWIGRRTAIALQEGDR